MLVITCRAVISSICARRDRWLVDQVPRRDTRLLSLIGWARSLEGPTWQYVFNWPGSLGTRTDRPKLIEGYSKPRKLQYTEITPKHRHTFQSTLPPFDWPLFHCSTFSPFYLPLFHLPLFQLSPFHLPLFHPSTLPPFHSSTFHPSTVPLSTVPLSTLPIFHPFTLPPSTLPPFHFPPLYCSTEQEQGTLHWRHILKLQLLNYIHTNL